MADNLLQQLKEFDENRDSFPGEHWIVLAAGIGVWWASRKSPSLLTRTLGLMAGTALVGRAASGRDGLSRVLRYTPVGSSIPRRIQQPLRRVS